MAWELWHPVFLACVKVLEVEDYTTQRKLFLLRHCLGGVSQKEFMNLLPLENPGNIDVFQYVSRQLEQRYGKKVNVVMERYKFY